ncbi:MAG: hypothetical protein ABIJ12_08150 [bacterium]
MLAAFQVLREITPLSRGAGNKICFGYNRLGQGKTRSGRSDQTPQHTLDCMGYPVNRDTESVSK